MTREVIRPGASPLTILQRLHGITEELMGYQVELATLLHAEKEGRVRSWEAYSPTANYGKDSVSARDRTAEFSVMNLTLDIIDIKGEIAAIETEREYLTLLLSYTTED